MLGLLVTGRPERHRKSLILNLQELQQLIEFISRSGFSHFEMEKEGFKLKLVRGSLATQGEATAPPVALAPEVVVTERNGQPAVDVDPVVAAAEELHEIKSPIVGTFYRSPNPEADPFVEAGSHITAGQTLCVVEAMKLMNEIESDVEGEVVDIQVANGQPVEYGEVLFRVRLGEN